MEVQKYVIHAIHPRHLTTAVHLIRKSLIVPFPQATKFITFTPSIIFYMKKFCQEQQRKKTEFN